MTREEIQDIIEGKRGDDQQFEMLKFIITQNIDRAFFAHRVSAFNNFELRTSLQGTLLTHRGDRTPRPQTAS